MIRNRRLSGVTLVELLVYSVIFLTVAGFLVGILTIALRIQSRESAAAEITQEMDFVLQNIQRYVQESSLIDMPAGTATSTLKLRTKSTSTDPVLIFANATNTAIFLQEGSGAANPLTSGRILVGNFLVTKYENPGGHATVQIELTLNFNTSTAPAFADVSRTLRTAIARVSAATFDSNILPNAGNTWSIGNSETTWVNAFFSGQVGIGNPPLLDSTLELGGSSAAISLNENTSAPSAPSSGNEVRIYMKGDAIVFQYNDAGTVRYKYLILSGTGVTWTHATSSP